MGNTNWKSLDDDVVTHILLFVTSSTLAKCNLVCRRLSQLTKHDFIWKSLCLKVLGFEESELPVNNLKQFFKQHCFSFDLKKHGPSIGLENYCRNLICNIADYGGWEHAVFSRPFIAGNIYKFSLTFLELSNAPRNPWQTSIGVMSDTEFQHFPVTEKGTHTVVGYHSGQGFGYLPFIGEIMRVTSKKYTPLRLKKGDKVTVVVDMTHSSKESDELIHSTMSTYSFENKFETSGANVRFFLNDDDLGVAFRGVHGQSLYFVVSVVGSHNILVNIL